VNPAASRLDIGPPFGEAFAASHGTGRRQFAPNNDFNRIVLADIFFLYPC